MQLTGQQSSDNSSIDLLKWLDNPSLTNGITSFESRHTESFVSYADLAVDVHRIAAAIQTVAGRGRPVLLCQSGGVNFVASFFACLLAGSTVSILSPPEAFTERADYDSHARDIMDALRPGLVIVDDDSLAGRFVDGPEVRSLDSLRCTSGAPIGKEPIGDRDALVQFTSGSAGRARGVRITGDALSSNVAAIRSWLQLTRSDTTISWLPMHHDMGLVGCMITPVVTQSSLELMTPAQFIRSPLRFLRRFDGKASVTASPTFGLEYILRRVKPDDLSDLDLSGLRSVIVGAERVGSSTVEAFVQLLEPTGFGRSAVCPAYGLAEATLAVTGGPLDEVARVMRLDDGTELVSCGVPLHTSINVRIEDDAGRVVEDGALGEIVVRSPSIASGYLGERRASGTEIVDGMLYTGDIGTMVDGELFVVGRAGDSVKVRGVPVFAEDLEQCVVEHGITRRERVVALVGNRSDGAAVIRILIEGDVADGSGGRMTRIAQLRQGCDLRLYSVKKGTIRRTSSGKPRRRVMWSTFVEAPAGDDVTELVFAD